MKNNKNTASLFKRGNINILLKKVNCNSPGNKIKPLIIYDDSL